MDLRVTESKIKSICESLASEEGAYMGDHKSLVNIFTFLDFLSRRHFMNALNIP